MEDFGIHKQINKRKMIVPRSFLGDDAMNLEKYLEKGVAAAEGEERTWAGKKYKKVGGKWIPAGKGGEKKAAPESKSKSTPKESEDKKPGAATGNSEANPVGTHEVAQLTHLKSVVDSDPAKAAEIFASLTPEAQAVVPQDIANKLVAASHATPEDTTPKFDDLGKPEKKEAKPKMEAEVKSKKVSSTSPANTYKQQQRENMKKTSEPKKKEMSFREVLTSKDTRGIVDSIEEYSSDLKDQPGRTEHIEGLRHQVSELEKKTGMKYDISEEETAYKKEFDGMEKEKKKLEKKVDKLSGGTSASGANKRKLQAAAKELGEIKKQLKNYSPNKIEKAYQILGL